MSRSSFSRSAVVALTGALSLVSTSGCLIYNDSLLLEDDGAGGDGGSGGGQGGSTGGAAPGGTHLLISEVLVAPSEGEMVEVFNPSANAVSLDGVYLTDIADYHLITSGMAMPGTTDFLVQFPPGTSIDSGQRLSIALDTEVGFTGFHGQPPSFELQELPGTHSPSSGLSNNDEIIVLFQWDGSSPQVQDLDYIIWGDASDAVDKSAVDGYAADTPADMQNVLGAPGTLALHRCNNDEPGETKDGGNGVTGHDETSESLTSSFGLGSATPGSSPPAGTCP